MPFVSCARLVRLCLGPTSVSARKLAHGNPLTILGIDLCIKHDGVVLWPAEEKVANWIQLKKSLPAVEQWSMLFLFTYTFLLRLPSEALPVVF